MALTPKDIDALHDSVKEIADLWLRIKLVFMKSFSGGGLTREHEAAYLQLKSDISRISRTLEKTLPSGLDFEREKMIEMLKNAITMDHLQKLPEKDQQSLLKMWHKIYIQMERALGAMETMRSGYFPHAHRPMLKLAPLPKSKSRDIVLNK